jgi:hypothetical protein
MKIARFLWVRGLVAVALLPALSVLCLVNPRLALVTLPTLAFCILVLNGVPASTQSSAVDAF